MWHPLNYKLQWGIFTLLTANFTSSNNEWIAFTGNVWQRILFSNFCSKKHFLKKIIIGNMFYYGKGIKQINKIIEIKNLSTFVKLIILFYFFCIIKDILTSYSFSKNASLLQII